MSVLVYIQNFNGKLRTQNLELASYGKEIARRQNLVLKAVVIGDIDVVLLEKLGEYGVEKLIHVVDSRINSRINKAYTRIIEQIAVQEEATIILFSDNNTGKALGPRLSVRLKAGFVTGVVDLPVSFSPLVIRKKVFSGKAFANVRLNSEIKILSLIVNSFGVRVNKEAIVIESFTPELGESDLLVQVSETIPSDEGVSLSDAEIVVSGGRGLKGPDNWQVLEDLAGELNAATACSRPVSDEGWRPTKEHVGQTGKIIAPNLYIAIGISGAIQHVAGVSGSKKILAINTDPEAPIFKVADYGVVGDALTVLPELTDSIKRFKAQHK